MTKKKIRRIRYERLKKAPQERPKRVLRKIIIALMTSVLVILVILISKPSLLVVKNMEEHKVNITSLMEQSIEATLYRYEKYDMLDVNIKKLKEDIVIVNITFGNVTIFPNSKTIINPKDSIVGDKLYLNRSSINIQYRFMVHQNVENLRIHFTYDNESKYIDIPVHITRPIKSNEVYGTMIIKRDKMINIMAEVELGETWGKIDHINFSIIMSGMKIAEYKIWPSNYTKIEAKLNDKSIDISKDYIKGPGKLRLQVIVENEDLIRACKTGTCSLEIIFTDGYTIPIPLKVFKTL